MLVGVDEAAAVAHSRDMELSVNIEARSAPPVRTLSDAERRDWLRLSRSENVGPITFFRLIERFGSAAAALDALPGLARRGGRRTTLALCPPADAEREIEATTAAGARLVACREPAYPQALAAIPDPPPLIAVKGDPALLAQPAVAVVGARNASALGLRFARDMAAELGRRGLVVVSGLARGIDAAAHEGALATGTVAVLGGGIDVVYPPEHETLYERIAERGALIAETPAGTEPRARHFPRRNRLISGLSLGVLVVEAAPRSGSLITARMALEQGREVFAVPGSPLDPRARGPNGLIRQGAVLTETADDVVAALAPMAPIAPDPLAEPRPEGFAPPEASESEIADGRALVAERLGPAPVAVDELVRQTHLTPAALLTILLEFELAGRLVRHPGNKVSAA